MGLVIESPELARRIARAFTTLIPERAYRVRVNEAGEMQWVEQREGKTIVHNEEPGSSWWRHLLLSVLSVLPIEWLL